jgi:hypothetical protein
MKSVAAGVSGRAAKKHVQKTAISAYQSEDHARYETAELVADEAA